MGIPRYVKSLRHKYKGIFRRQLPGNVSSFSIDMNGMIHQALQQTYKYGEFEDERMQPLLRAKNPAELEMEFQRTLMSNFMNVFSMVLPKDCLVIAVDGVAPMAKITQQRSRRYRSARDQQGSQIFDSNSVTPGTDFMFRLDTFIRVWLEENIRFLPPKVIYSSHMTPGEGEHKIMDMYRAGEIWGPSAETGGSHILYGLDADLVMLSMLSPQPSIMLMREDVQDIVDIEALRTAIIEDIKGPIDDYVLMMFLVGNDFLPHGPAFEDLGKASDAFIEVYKRAGKDLTNRIELTASGETVVDRIAENPEQKDYLKTLEVTRNTQWEINWDGFNAFLQELAKEEPVMLSEISVNQPTYPLKALEKALRGGSFHYDIFRGAWYVHALGSKGDHDAMHNLMELLALYEPEEGEFDEFGDKPDYPIATISPVTQRTVEEMVKEYLRGLSWVYLYYRKGTVSINQGWFYPYRYAPLISDVSSIVELLNGRQIHGYTANLAMIPFNPIHQLLSVLPTKSIHLLPREFRSLMANDSPILDLMPNKFKIDYEGFSAEWQGIPVLPFVNRDRVLAAVASVDVDDRITQTYAPQDSLVYHHVEEPETLEDVMTQLEERKIGYQKQLGYGNVMNNPRRGRGGTRITTKPTLQGHHKTPARGAYRGRGRGRGSYKPYAGSVIAGTAPKIGGTAGMQFLPPQIDQKAAEAPRVERTEKRKTRATRGTRGRGRGRDKTQTLGRVKPYKPLTKPVNTPTKTVALAPTKPLGMAPTRPVGRAPTLPIVNTPSRPATKPIKTSVVTPSRAVTAQTKPAITRTAPIKVTRPRTAVAPVVRPTLTGRSPTKDLAKSTATKKETVKPKLTQTQKKKVWLEQDTLM